MKMLKTVLISMAAIAGFSVAAVAADVPEGKLLYKSPGKPSHPIQVDFDLEGKAEIGKEMPLQVRVHSGMPLSDIRVQARPSSGLVMRDQAEQYLQKATATEPERMTYRLTPVADGMHEFVLKIVARHGDRLWSREVRLPIAVGEAAREKLEPKPVGDTVKAADGVREQRVRAID